MTKPTNYSTFPIPVRRRAGEAADVNADFMTTGTLLNTPTLYPSAYLVLTSKGYTKHYYAGTERVAARIGGGNLNHDIECIVNDSEAIDRATSLFWRCNNHVNSSKVWHQDLKKMKIVDINGDELKMIWDFEMNQVPSTQNAEIKPDPAGINKVIKHFSRPASQADPNLGDEPDVYFYHSDHLGGASWITDVNGIPVQHLQYMPFGEPFVNQHPAGYQERYTFTGKERDVETGYGYFGARYMDYSLLTSFLSVDRYADKYPFISPYAYCAWNPIRLIDPSGDSIIVCPQNRKDGNEKLLSSLSEKTGLRLFVDENGRMQYEKDGNGDPIVNGGSKTAREDMKKAIGDTEFNLVLQYKNGDASIEGAASDRRRPEFYASRIFVDIADFSGSEHKTFDIGMVFLHEFQHAYFGLSDNVDRFKEIYSCKDPYYYKKGYRGDVVDKVNIYRKELGLPTREAYKKSPFTNKIPFSDGKNTLWLDGWE